MLREVNITITFHQTSFFDKSEEMLREVDITKLGLTRNSQDEEHTKYGRYLLEMRTSHRLAILNGLERYPLANSFTCFPHMNGANTVDYVLAQAKFVTHI